MIEEDFGFVYGKTTENAQKLLAAADELGLPQETIKAGDDGFYVPVSVVDYLFPDSAVPVKEG
jgi:hypothetical protein